VTDSISIPTPKFRPDSKKYPCEFPLTLEDFDDIHKQDRLFFEKCLKDFPLKGFAQLVIALGNDITDFVAKGDSMDCFESFSHFRAFVCTVNHFAKNSPERITFMSVNGLPRLCLRPRNSDWRRMLTHYECTRQHNKEHGYAEDFDYFKSKPVYFDTLDDFVAAVAKYMRKNGYAF
jgi:hypothetical protein